MKSSAARTKYSRDIVALTGSILGLLASLLDWFVLKPNRLASGTGLNIAEALGWHYTIIIACLWFLCVFLSLVEKTHKRGILLAVVANIIIILSAIILMLGSSQAVTGEMPRVSLSIGVWLTCLAVYMLLFTVGQRGTPGSFLTASLPM